MQTVTKALAPIFAELNRTSEDTNRANYLCLLAGKPFGSATQFIKKDFKNQARDTDYGLVLNALAEHAYAQLPEAEVIETEAAAQVEPTRDDAAESFMAEALGHLASGADDDAPSGGGSSILVHERPALVLDARPALVTNTQLGLAEVLAAPVPAKTRTYTPLAHGDLINLVKELLDKRGLSIKDERYNNNRMGQQMFGHMTVEGWNVEQDMSIGFRNSYDKSMQAGVVAGGRVVVCSNMMFVGNFKAMKMHYGNIANELRDAVQLAIDNLETNYRQLQVDTEKLQSVKVNERLIHEILGELFFSESIVTETQLKVIRSEMKEQARFGVETMWDIYNHTTEALKSTPAGQMVDRHVAAHNFYLAKA